MGREGRAPRPGDGSKPAETLYTLRTLNGVIHTMKDKGQDTAAIKATAVALCEQLKAEINAV